MKQSFNPLKFLMRKGSGSVFLLAGVLLVLACVAEIFRILFFMPLPLIIPSPVEEGSVVKEPKISFTKNVFDDLHTKYPSYKKETVPLQRYDIFSFAYNPYLGKKDSFVKLVIFTDMACTSCRQEVAYTLDQLAGYMDKIQVIFKFYPQNGKDLEGGMFDQIAKRADVYPNYLNRMLAKQTEVGADDFIYTLEKTGVSMTRLRLFMGEHSNEILEDVRKDLEQAEHLGLKKYALPVLYLNGYRIGQEGLPIHRLTDFVATLLDGKDL